MIAAKKVSRDASLHEKAVQKVAKDQHNVPKRPRKKPARKVQDATTLKMDMRVWKEALRIAGGDRQRIQVINEQEVIVWNSWTWRNHNTPLSGR